MGTAGGGDEGVAAVTGADGRRRARLLLRVRWSDVDLFGHVNNAAFLRYLDDARFALFPAMGVDAAGRLTEAQLVVVKHEIEYVAPAPFRSEPLAVDVWVPRTGRSSVDFAYEVLDAGAPAADEGRDGDPGRAGRLPAVYLRARSRMVQVEARTGRPRPFTPAELSVFEAYPGPPPELRGW
ncbi:acyl-CoA thioesterase [Cellulomonas endophytica]|uniref:acyl-CoA thioesterase n=1 Tax=Cellulomonas endophytica TaxID=2494735 RepID=UPI001F0C1C05|nr:thioesterase family protein [Cellulomonas endophytica]